ncbi:MAG: hypothetical protein H6742_07150 [Alphaproteobacteria bacterium]|nr:hypothetical protein [Alphaproteobacteria bacterium]
MLSAVLALLLPALSLAASAQEPAVEPAAEPAVEPVAAPATEATVAADWRDVYAVARDLQQTLDGPLVLAHRSDDARTTARRVGALFGRDEVVPRPLATVGDLAAEQRLSLANAGARCGLLLSPGPQGYTLDAFGDCSPARRAPPQRARMDLVARRGDPSWTVIDDRGVRVDAWRYAILLDEPDLRDRLVRERRRQRGVARALQWSGAVVLGAAVVPLATSFGAPPPQARDQRGTSAFLAATGTTLLVGGQLRRRGLDARQGEVGRYVHPTDARRALEEWNAAIDADARRTTAPDGAAVGGQVPEEAPPAPEAPAPEAPAPEAPAPEAPAPEAPPPEEPAP